MTFPHEFRFWETSIHGTKTYIRAGNIESDDDVTNNGAGLYHEHFYAYGCQKLRKKRKLTLLFFESLQKGRNM